MTDNTYEDCRHNDEGWCELQPEKFPGNHYLRCEKKSIPTVVKYEFKDTIWLTGSSIFKPDPENPVYLKSCDICKFQDSEIEIIQDLCIECKNAFCRVLKHLPFCRLREELK